MQGAGVESKSLSNLVCFTEPSFAPSDPQVVNVPPAEIANLVVVRLLYINPAVRGTRQGR